MATTASAFEDREMSIGRVFERAFATIAHNPITVFAIAIVVGGIPSAIINYVMLMERGAQPDMRAVWGVALFGILAGTVIGAIVQGAMTRATVAEGEGQRASFLDCLATGGRSFLPLIGVGILFGLGIMIGWILLIVPGIIALVAWSVAGPAVVVERQGVFNAFSRSRELTSGSRWKIFGLFLALLAIYLLIFGLFSLIGLSTMSAKPTLTVGGVIANVISSAIINLLWGTIQPSLYIELRQAKGGGDLESLADIFA